VGDAPVLQGLARQLNDALPQTQCQRCGYPDCARYALAMAEQGEAHNRCPPGGAEGAARLAALTGQTPLPLDPGCGPEGPLRLARIDEAWCIGCTLCIEACPVDCIVGAAKRMHAVIEAQCTGCALCLPACPVDCIGMIDVSSPRTGWAAWSPAQAQAAQGRYQGRLQRQTRVQQQQASLLEPAAPRLAPPSSPDAGLPGPQLGEDPQPGNRRRR
jgi:Na+-translocating ferredoxin:NAD+ oxidoreductase subunit B